jgi:hypothetical protein
MPSKIIKNVDVVEHQWGGLVFQPLTQNTINDTERLRLIDDQHFLDSLTDGNAVVNNGDTDLPADQALLFLHNQLIFIHEDMDLYPAVGANAAAAVKVSGAIAGFEFRVGDEMFTQGRLDDIVGESVEFESHWCLDNTEADKWIAFEVSLLTTNGGGDKIVTTPDVVATAGPFSVPATANQIFRLGGMLPSSFFENGEKYIYFGIKRIDAVPLGKNNPTNNPILFRVCKIYTRRLDE